jgi:hypothetical protein
MPDDAAHPRGAARWPRWLGRAGAAVLVALLAVLAWESAVHSVDFPIYHRVARQVLAGDYELYPMGLYDGGPVTPHGFRYAPAVAFLFVPFGLLPLELAALAFFALKIGAFVYIALVLSRYLGLESQHRTLMAMSVVIVGGYLVEEFRFGNFHFLSVALMVLAFDSAERGKVALPATALALAIATKLTPVLLLGYFALRRRVAVSAATLAVLALIWALPSTVVGFGMNNHLTEGFARYAVQKVDEEDNYALRGVLFRYLTPDHRSNPTYPKTSLAQLSTQTVSAIWIALVVIGGLALAMALWTESPAPAVRLLEFSLVLAAMLLASPHTQRRHLTALYVPALALLALWPAVRARSGGTEIRFGLAVTAAVSTVLPLLFGGRQLALRYEAFSPYFFGTLALFVVLLLLTRRMKSRSAGL